MELERRRASLARAMLARCCAVRPKAREGRKALDQVGDMAPEMFEAAPPFPCER